MRPNQHNNNNNNKRSRGRGRRNTGSSSGGGGGGNPINRVYESNGPDIKVRGTAQTVADKYMQLGRDAHSSSDNVMAESYYQHAEHYLRIVTAAQAYLQQTQQQYRQDGDDGEDDGDIDGGQEGDDDEAPQVAAVERRDYPPQRPQEPAEQPDVMAYEHPISYAPPQQQRQERDFRPRGDGQPGQGRERFRPRSERPRDQQPRDQQPQAEARFEPQPRPEPRPRPVQAVEVVPVAPQPQPRLEEPVTAVEPGGNPFGDAEQPSFLRRPAVARPRRPRRVAADEAAADSEMAVATEPPSAE